MTTKQQAVTAKGGRKLTAKQAAFVQEYLIDLNATQAAIRAGYSGKTAQQTGSENLAKPVIQSAIQEALNKRKERTEVTQDYVIRELVNVIEICTGQKDTAITEVIKNFQEGSIDAHDVSKKLFDASGANRALELLGKHLGMFADKHEITGKDGGPVEMITLTKEAYKEARKEMLANDDC